MATLFELSDQHLRLEQLIEEAAEESLGEVTPEIEALQEELLASEFELSNKLDSYAYVIQRLDANAAILKARADALAARSRSLASRSAWMRERLLVFLQARGVSRVEGDFVISVRNNGGVLPLVFASDFDLSRLPNKMIRIKTEPDNSAIRDALQGGQELPGVQLGERGKSVSIR